MRVKNFIMVLTGVAGRYVIWYETPNRDKRVVWPNISRNHSEYSEVGEQSL